MNNYRIVKKFAAIDTMNDNFYEIDLRRIKYEAPTIDVFDPNIKIEGNPAASGVDAMEVGNYFPNS